MLFVWINHCFDVWSSLHDLLVWKNTFVAGESERELLISPRRVGLT